MKKHLGCFAVLAIATLLSLTRAEAVMPDLELDQGAPDVHHFKDAQGNNCISVGNGTLCDSQSNDNMGQASEVLVPAPRAQESAPSQAAASAAVAAPASVPVNAAAEGLKCRELFSYGPNSLLCDNTLVDAEGTVSCASRYSHMTDTQGGATVYALCGGVRSIGDADQTISCFTQWRAAANMRGVPTDLDSARICRNDASWREALAAYTQLRGYSDSNALSAGNLWDVVKYTSDAGRTVACVRTGVSQGGPSTWNNVQPCVTPAPASALW